MSRYTKREFRLGEFWVGRKPGRAGWCRCWYDRGRRQTRYQSLGTDDFQRACEALTDWFVLNHRTRDAAPGDVLIEKVLMDYYLDHAVKIRSAEQAKISMRYWADFFGGKTVAELTIGEQERFVEHLREKDKSDGYIARILGVGRAALQRAARHQVLASVPHVIDLPGRNTRKLRLSMDQMAAMFETAETPHVRKFLMYAVCTLSRPEALFDLTIFQCDKEHRLIDLNPPGRKQTKKYRPVVPMVEALVPWVEPGQPAKKGPNRGQPVTHVIAYKGRPIRSIKTAFRAMRAAADLPEDTTPYIIRHTMASELRKRGVPSWEVSGMLGHKEAKSTTEIYATFDPSYLGQARSAIQRYVEELAPRVKGWQILRSVCVPEAPRSHLRVVTE